MSFAPQVPIRVDPETGVWSTDGLPMIYLPRHFYVNHHDAIEAAIGHPAFAKILYEAGHQSAWQWCDKEAVTHGLQGVAVFRHYMKRISQRGWGRFTIMSLDEATGAASIRLDHSIYVLHRADKARGCVCYAFSGWFSGALEWVGRNLGADWRLTTRESYCAASGSHDHCLFVTTPRQP
jgi:hypothetical protein